MNARIQPGDDSAMQRTGNSVTASPSLTRSGLSGNPVQCPASAETRICLYASAKTAQGLPQADGEHRMGIIPHARTDVQNRHGSRDHSALPRRNADGGRA